MKDEPRYDNTEDLNFYEITPAEQLEALRERAELIQESRNQLED